MDASTTQGNPFAAASQAGGGLGDLVTTLQGVVQNLSNGVSALQRNAFVLGGVTAINTLGTATGTSALQVIAADSTRTSLVFHNPNNATTVIVYPQKDVNGNALAPTFSAPGGGFIVLPMDFLPVTGNIQAAWFGVAQTGTACGLTITSSSQ